MQKQTHAAAATAGRRKTALIVVAPPRGSSAGPGFNLPHVRRKTNGGRAKDRKNPGDKAGGRAAPDARANDLVPSPLYSGERVRVRASSSSGRKCLPLTPALFPEYRGEGVSP